MAFPWSESVSLKPKGSVGASLVPFAFDVVAADVVVCDIDVGYRRCRSGHVAAGAVITLSQALSHGRRTALSLLLAVAVATGIVVLFLIGSFHTLVRVVAGNAGHFRFFVARAEPQAVGIPAMNRSSELV